MKTKAKAYDKPYHKDIKNIIYSNIKYRTHDWSGTNGRVCRWVRVDLEWIHFPLSHTHSAQDVLHPVHCLNRLYTFNCITKHISNTIIKFSDATTSLTAMRNLPITSVSETEELIADFQSLSRIHGPMTIECMIMESMGKLVDLIWSLSKSYIIKKAQQSLYFLWRLNMLNMLH